MRRNGSFYLITIQYRLDYNSDGNQSQYGPDSPDELSYTFHVL